MPVVWMIDPVTLMLMLLLMYVMHWIDFVAAAVLMWMGW
jgi:hypothetical protein